MESGKTGGVAAMFYFLLSQLTWINVLGLVAASVLAYVFRFKQKTKGLPPFPTIPLPIVGNLYHPGLISNMAAQLMRWREKVGDVYSMYVGTDLYIVVEGYDNVREVLVTHADKTASRPDLCHRSVEDKSLGITIASGDEWKERRGHLIFFLKNLGKGKNHLANFSKHEVQHLLQTLDKTNEQPVNFRPIIMRNLFTLFFSFLVGECYDVDSPTMDRLMEILTQGRTMPLKAGIVNAFPWVRHIPFDPLYIEELKEVDEKFKAFTDAVITRVKSRMVEGNQESFIESYLNAESKKINANKKTYLSDRDLNFNLEELYFAGADATASSLWWWLLHMVNFPDIQEKAFQEIKYVIGLENPPTLEDRTRLNFINALILDSLRMGSIGSITPPHSASETFTVKGYTIPKGVTILPILKSIHETDAFFDGNAAELKPERFLDDNGSLVRVEKSVPFSLGRRACPGQTLGLTLMFYYITCLLQRFRIEPEDPNNLPSMVGSHDGLFNAPKDFKVKFIRRCSEII